MYYENGFAIVGVGCRFPGGIESLDGLWDVLAKGADVVTNVPDSRFSIRRYWHPERQAPGRTCTTAAGIVGDIKAFDAAFFGMSPKEAEALDPQQRMVLEMAWEAFEDAGIKPSSVAGTNAAVYIGAASTDMGMIHSDDLSVTGPYGMTGTSLSIIANRLSYYFDLHGPSMTIDTACSSSLVALHEACRAMTAENLPLAIVGGVNVLLSPMPFVGFSKAHMLSKDGRCKVFDAEGNGYVRSEGGAVMIIKPLDAALRDGDAIHAVIRATGVNSDGRTNGIALPNGAAQKRLLQSIYEDPKVDRKRVAYLEAHGTGTAAGDPIETKSIGEVLGHRGEGEQPLLIGSVKSNLGHLETGSGMAGIAKAITVLREREVPANIQLNNLNPAIDFEGLGIRVAREKEPLPEVAGAPLVGVNSFGFGGTNAHVLLEDAGAAKEDVAAFDTGASSELYPLLLSAKSMESLRALAGAYAKRLSGADANTFNRTAAAAATQRERLSNALFMKVGIVSAAVDALNIFSTNGQLPACTEAGAWAVEHVASVVRAGKTAFVYSGNGSQWAGMGAALYAGEPSFKRVVDEIDETFFPLSGWKIGETFQKNDGDVAVDRTEVAQPLIFAVQVGVTALLADAGIKPDAVTGHSVGEVAAAWAAGCLTLADATKVIYERSALQGRMLGSGTMAAAKLPEEKLKALLADYPGVEIAGLNAVDNYTLSGDEASIDALRPLVKGAGGLFKKLALPYAFHSSRMGPLEDEIVRTLSDIVPQSPKIGFYSTVEGARTDGAVTGAAYWWRNIRQPVQFERAISALLNNGATKFIEVGPHAILLGYVRATAKTAGKDVFVHGTLAREGDLLQWQTACAQLQASVDVASLWPVVARDRTLPRYPWNKKTFWAEPTSESNHLYDAAPCHPLLGWSVSHAENVWENTVDLSLYPWLSGHEIDETVLFPAAGFLEAATAAARRYLEGQGIEGTVEVKNLAILRPLALEKFPSKKIRTAVSREGVLTMGSRDLLSNEEFLTHLAGRAVRSDAPRPAPRNIRVALNGAQGTTGAAEHLDIAGFYDALGAIGLKYSGAFRPIEDAWRLTSGESHDVRILVKLESRLAQADDGMVLPPALVDGALQGLFLALGCAAKAGGLDVGDVDLKVSYLPSWIGRAVIWAEGVPVWAQVRLIKVTPRSALVEFELMNEKGEVLAELRDVRFLRVHHKENGVEPAFYFDNWSIANSDRTAAACDADAALRSIQALESSARRAAEGIGWNAQKADESLTLLYWLSAALVREAATKNDSGEGWVPAEAFFCDGFADEAMEPFVDNLIALLKDAGYAEELDGLVRLKTFEGDDVPPSADMLLRTILAEAPSFWPLITSLGLVGKHLRALVAGEKHFEEVLPKFDAAVRPLLSRMPQAMIAERAMFAWVRANCEEAFRKSVRVRGLYVAAAGGRMLSGIRDAMAQADELCAVFADSRAVERAKAELAHVPGLSFMSFEKFLEGQSSAAGHFDWAILPEGLAFAENVPLVLSAVYDALLPGGSVLLNETTPNEAMNLLCGSRPGWWSPVAAKRSGEGITARASRLAGEADWLSVLEGTGFSVHAACGANAGNGASGETDDEALSLIAPKMLLVGCKATEAIDGFEANKAKAPDTNTQTDAGEGTDVEASASTVYAAIVADAESVDAGLTGAVLSVMKREGVCAEKTVVWADVLSNEKTFLQALPAGARLALFCGFNAADEASADAADATVSNFPLKLFKLLSAAEFMSEEGTLAPGIRIDVVVPRLSGLPQSRSACGSIANFAAADGALGLVRVFRNECRTVGARILSLGDCDVGTIRRAARWLLGDACDESAAVDGHLYERVVTSVDPCALAGSKSCTAHEEVLAFDSPGRLERLYWKPIEAPLPELKGDEIRVAVKATGLNFRDVMWAMGMLPDDALENGFSGPTMGLEAAGVVTAVGPDVRELKAGDEVVAFAPACFSSVITTTEGAAAKKPSTLSFAEAASVPVAFFTAWYAIHWLGRAKKGEKILIHGAAGGVGLAAVQVAALLGLEVYATAGSDAKRTLLSRLGVKHVYNSRSLAFGEEIRRDTNGRGVDLVLNSLAGDGAEKSLDLLAPLGRFLELGKRDFYADSAMFVRPFRRNISYFGIDADQILVDAPELAHELFAEVLGHFETGDFRPLPFMMFPAENAAEAFQTMQASQHIGKLVVVRGARSNAANDSEAPAACEAQLGCGTKHAKRFEDLVAGGTVIISGGLGGLGRKTALRMAERGAKALVLLSRSGRTDATKDFIDTLEARGIVVRAPRLDLGSADEREVFAALDTALEGLPPVCGIVHAAGVIRDAFMKNLRDAEAVMPWGPKVRGAQSLVDFAVNAGIAGTTLKFFAAFSSATVLLGNPGQANYVAANAGMEAVLERARKAGIPAISVGWGPVGDVGMLEHNAQARIVLETTLGTPALNSSDVLDALEAAVLEGKTASSFFAVNWQRLSGLPLYADERFCVMRERFGGAREEGVSLADRFAGKTDEEAVAILTQCVAEEVASLMGVAAQELNVNQPVADIGMDSLMVVELAAALEERLGLRIPAVSLSGGATIHTIAERFWQMIDKKNADEQTLDVLAEKHGVALTEEMKTDVLKNVGGAA